MSVHSRQLILHLITALSFGGFLHAEPLRVEQNDSIVILGNTFAERMQLFGYFETFLHCRFPDHHLRIRNMGWSADEVDARMRPRPAGFPKLFDELKVHEADLLFLCFGFNESFRGAAEVDHFRTGLANLVKELQSQKFNGKSAPRIVIVSPIAFEDLGGNLPAGIDENRNLDLYAKASAQVARDSGSRFLDLFTPTKKWMAEHPKQRKLTFNGVHLTEYGYWVVSQQMAAGLLLLADSIVPSPEGTAEKIRRAVYEKNHHYFTWWHPPNDFYIHGGRNRSRGAMHLKREREQRKLLIAASERELWAMPKPNPAEVWKSKPVDGTPIWFPTPKSRSIPGMEKKDEAKWEVAGDGPADKHLRSPADQLKMFEVADGYEVNLFASELRFPIANPFAIHFDARNRLWVANTPTWPHSLPGKQPKDSIIILEDKDRDGVADQHTVFLENMKLIHGFAIGDGGAYVAQVPNLIFAKDSKGDGKADWVRTVLHGFGAEDAEHAMNNFRWSPGGSLYFSQGIFYNTQVETPYGPQRVRDAAVFRYTPRDRRLDIPVSHAFWNPYGKVFDRWGRGILLDASAGQYYPMDVISTPFHFPKKKDRTNHLSFGPNGTIAAGCDFVHNRHFPDDVQGRFVVNHCERDVGVHWYDLKQKGSVYEAKRLEPLAVCKDHNFRPVAMTWGPDGALYVADFYTHIFENVNFSKRHPGRDHAHGRIWRISHKSRAKLEAPVIIGRPVPELLDLLILPESLTRELVRGELGRRPDAEVIPFLDKWIAKMDATNPKNDHHLVEALWVYQGLGVANDSLLRRLLGAKTPEARLAATGVLRFWQDEMHDSIDLIRRRANDPDARVRLHAVLASGHSKSPRAKETALAIKKHTMDPGLDYALDQTVKYFDQTVENDSARVASLMDQIEGGTNRGIASSALRALDQAVWPVNRLDGLAESVLAYLKSVPAAGRGGSIEFLESMALGRELAALLPERRGVDFAAALDRLKVSTFLIKTNPGLLLYDRTRLAVGVGSKVGILFDNNDLMPHNLVVVAPGAIEEVGKAADLMAAEAGALANSYVPDSKKVLWATKLLQPGERQKITFTAPDEPGEYPFVCTYPGHWRSMRGTLVVIASGK